MATPARFPIWMLILTLPLTAVLWAQGPCVVTVKTDVLLEAEELMLTDLVAADSCGDILREAGRVRIGKAPQAGSPRVLEAAEIRGWLERLAAVHYSHQWIIPQRVIVRRGGGAVSCSVIASQVFPHSGQGASFNAVNCGADGRIRRDARLEVTHQRWDSFLRRWEFITRCIDPRDCVPFLTTGPTLPGSVRQGAAEAAHKRSSPHSAATVLVRAGQKASLLWDSSGIRTVVPVVCLEDGRQGDAVRTRLLWSGRVLQARVTAIGYLQAYP